MSITLTGKEKQRPISVTMDTGTNILKKTISKSNLTLYLKRTHQDQVELIPGRQHWFNSWKINITHHTKKTSKN